MGHRLPAGGLVPLSYQYHLLMDEDRCHRFQRAIEKQVPQGGVVLEAGAGTGILSYFAAQKARKVYTVERDPAVAAACRQFIKTNGLESRVEVVHGSASEFVPPEPVDAVICEMLHVALINEQQVPVMNAIRRNLTRAFPDHPYVTVPGTTMNYVQLINENQNFYGYQTQLVRYAHPALVDPRAIPMSPLVPYWETDFAGLVNPHVNETVNAEITEDGVVNGVRFLTQAALYLDEQSMDPASLIDWFLMWLVLPIEETRVKAGEILRVNLQYTPGCSLEELRITTAPASRPQLEAVVAA
ncbi:MAG: methyltransferase domain-containing protein [Armatimonadetes bacterium]|nr:methyltransferase domain-containing protein [Armatimonadota bacterium]